MNKTLLQETASAEAQMRNSTSATVGNCARRGTSRAPYLRTLACAIAMVMASPMVLAQKGGEKTPQKSFATPIEAVAAMADAVKSDDAVKLKTILGPGGGKLINSGDAVADAARRKEFATNFDTANKVRLEGDSRAIVLIGKDEWPMPIPIVKSADGWRFDTKEGSKEILNRRIGQNELAAIEVCRAIVDAQREYVAKDQDKNGLLEYAPKFVSSPGMKDGLYWETNTGEPQSPLGPLIAAAAKEGYARNAALPLDPYHGYYYRILTRQGKDARGGAYDYMVKGKMIAGFAVVAYPARYGASGIMSFIVNHDGIVYEKDLGKNTAAVAEKMASFDPDASWKRP
jgi:hypothetical protein